MKTADSDLDAALAQRPGKVERARKLIRLNTRKHHHAVAGGGDQRGEADGAYARVGLVESVDLEFELGREHAALRTIPDDAIERGQRIGRNRRAQPLNDVAVIVVVRRLHQYQAKA